MPNFDERYSELLSECGGNLVPFLDSIFGFLSRRSDFFQLKPDGQVDSVVGFHPGQNKKLLLSVMSKWEKFAQEESEKNHKLSQADVPVAVQHEEVVSSSSSNLSRNLNLNKSEKISPSHKKLEIAGDPVNGADQGTYKWSQTTSDLEIIVLVDKLVLKGNLVKVACTKNSIKVSLSGKSRTGNPTFDSLISNGQVLVDGFLSNEIKPSEMIWNLMPGSHILISLEKAKEGPLWPKLMENEEVRTNLSYDKPFTELRDDDKIAVEYAISQQAKKDQDDKKLETVLRDAWNQEGSPFQGQPFDPSVLSNMQTK